MTDPRISRETPDLDGDELMLTVEGGIAHLTINRPARKNAITRAMWLAIAGKVAELGRDSGVRVLVLSGTGGNFSAGADIGEFDTVRRDAETARDYERANSDAFAAIRNAPFPVIAATALASLAYPAALGCTASDL